MSRVRHVVTVLVGACLVVLSPMIATSTPSEHAIVTGNVRLSDETWVLIDIQPGYPGLIGKAWLSRLAPEEVHVVEIEIDCVEASWHQPVYPIPPYLPYHAVAASGVAASSGSRYYITAYDLVVRPAGFGDRLVIETEPGPEACGTSGSAGDPVKTGEIVIGP